MDGKWNLDLLVKLLKDKGKSKEKEHLTNTAYESVVEKLEIGLLFEKSYYEILKEYNELKQKYEILEMDVKDTYDSSQEIIFEYQEEIEKLKTLLHKIYMNRNGILYLDEGRNMTFLPILFTEEEIELMGGVKR